MNNTIFDEPTQMATYPKPMPGGNLPQAEGVGMPVMFRPPSAPNEGQFPELEFMARMAAGVERDESQMIKRAERVGEMLGQRALYSFPAGGGRVEGPTVQLAEALATEWGYLMWSARIVDQEGDRVTLMAVVVDALRCTVCARPGVFTLPPAPGKFANKAAQAARWEAMQTQAAISKCIRTALLHALPDWYIEAAVEASRNHVNDKYLGGRPIGEARTASVEAFAKFDINREQLAHHMGAPPELWTVTDIVTLRTLYQDIKSGRQSIEAVFGPQATVSEKPAKPSGADAVKQAAKSKKRGKKVDDAPGEQGDLLPEDPAIQPDGTLEPGAEG